ncbi:MAG: GNAT family N-acetyltransferase [Ardenticatenales bacterium]|nr:GNAT family N-acetyltransferase [Ardenticatenales bacterium]
MNYQLSETNVFDDYAAIAALQQLVTLSPESAEEMHSAETEPSATVRRRRVVARNEAGTIIGTSQLRLRAPAPDSYTFLVVSVDPAHRRRGAGTALYEEAMAFVRQHESATLITAFPDNDSDAYRFAEQRGFVLDQHWVHFALDLASFDMPRFAQVKQAVQQQGIRFFALADVGNSLEYQRKLYDLNRRTSLDAPGEDTFPSFEEFVEDICTAPWFRADGQIIAADGERWVGLGAVGLEGNIAHNAFTGVDQEYRRRHIAEALTLRTIEYAQEHGATQLQVSNDSRNTGMLRMQEKLGYYPIPGRYVMTKEIE